jgi:uncharacterized protein DUF72
MDDSEQIKLFEEGLYLGTSSWSYADWEGMVYPSGTPPAGKLARYVERFAKVEIDSSFYGVPKGSTMKRWRGSRPRVLFRAHLARVGSVLLWAWQPAEVDNPSWKPPS